MSNLAAAGRSCGAERHLVGVGGQRPADALPPGARAPGVAKTSAEESVSAKSDVDHDLDNDASSVATGVSDEISRSSIPTPTANMNGTKEEDDNNNEE